MSDFLKVFLGLFGTALTALATWLTKAITNWINAKVKEKKFATYATTVTTIVTNAVASITQSFVDTLKKKGKFNQEAQEEAKAKAMVIIESQLTSELRKYITENFGDVKEYLQNKIEATIYSLKNK